MVLKVGAILKYVKDFADGTQVATQTLNGKTVTNVTKNGRTWLTRAKSVERYPVGDKNVITIKKARKHTDSHPHGAYEEFVELDKVYSREGNLLGTRHTFLGKGDTNPPLSVKDLACGDTRKRTFYNNSGIRDSAYHGEGYIEFNSNGLPVFNLSTMGLDKFV